MKKLLLVSNPQDDESLPGYLLRLAHINGYESVNWIYSLIGISKKRVVKITPDKESLIKLEYLTGIKEDFLWRISYYGDFIHYDKSIKDECLMNGINSKLDKICPLCFKDNPYQRKVWNYSINMVCPKHNIVLISHCSKCGKGILPTRNKLLVCNCGKVLGDLPILETERKNVLHSIVINRIYYKNYSNISNEKNPLYTLQYAELFGLIISLWRRIRGSSKFDRIDVNKSPQDKIHFQSLIDTFSIFNKWPTGYYSFLDKVNQNELGGKSKNFGRFYRELNNKFNKTEYQFLIRKFHEYIAKTWYKPVMVGENDLNTHEYISGEQTMHLLNIDRRKLNYLLEKEVFKSRIVKINDYRHTSIRTDSIKQYLVDSKNHINYVDAYKKLGISRERFNEFVKYGLVNQIIEFIDYGRKGLKIYDLRSVNNLLQQNFNKNKSCLDNEELVSYSKATNIAHSNGVHICELLQNDFKPVQERDGTGLKKFYYLKEHLYKLIEEKKEKKIEKGEKLLAAKEVAKKININENFISDIIRRGFFGERKKNSKFSLSDIEKFMNEYVLLKEIAVRHNTNPVYMLRKLLESGINPISGKIVNGGECYLFIRDDVKQFI